MPYGSASMGTGGEDLRLALAHHTRRVLQDGWAVLEAVSNTEIAIMCRQPVGAVPYLLPSVASLYCGAILEFTTGILAGIPAAGGIYGRIQTTVQSVSSTTTSSGPSTILVVRDALPALPNPGDEFVLYVPPPVEQAYLVFRVDLTVARTAQALGVGGGGSSLTVVSLGGAPWSIQFVQAGQPGPVVYSTDLYQGSEFVMMFDEVLMTNNAAPSGTAEAVLFVGKR